MKYHPNPFIRMAIDKFYEEQRLKEETDQDKAVEDVQRQIRQLQTKEKAEKVLQIIREVATKRQQEIFFTFVNSGSLREAGKLLNLPHQRVHTVVVRLKKIIIEKMSNPQLILV